MAVGIRFSFDTLFFFDFDVCVGIEENLNLRHRTNYDIRVYVHTNLVGLFCDAG